MSTNQIKKNTSMHPRKTFLVKPSMHESIGIRKFVSKQDIERFKSLRKK